MSYTNAPRTTMYYSRADDSWYGWWADREPATISAARMQDAYLDLFRAYQQQGLTAGAAGQQAYADVHSMTYWNARAAADQAQNAWGVWDGLGLAVMLVLLVVQFLR